MGDERNMRRILVTGANKGIGLAIVKKLLQGFLDTHLYLGSRDVERGERAVQEVVTELGEEFSSRLDMIQLDVCSDLSVEEALKNLKTKLGERGRLYGLVNNAGGILSDARQTIQLNTYGPIRVCQAFIPLIQPDQGRIVQISSAAGPNFVSNCRRDIQDLLVSPDVTFSQVEQKVVEPFLQVKEDQTITEEDKTAALEKIGLHDSGLVGASYGVSKAALNAYTVELARKHPNLLINSCTPGFIETDLTRPMAEKAGKTPEEMGMKKTENGTVAAVFLMMRDLKAEIAGYQSGRYYGSDGVWSPLHKYRSPGDPPYDGSYP